MIEEQIAAELGVAPARVRAAIGLLDDGATVPFIARYRKEATEGLDDVQLRRLEARLIYLRELAERREAVINRIREQGKLTPDLERALREADTKARLEDLYLPYKPKRRTRAQIAREAGLEPLAMALLDDPEQAPEALAGAYVNHDRGIADVGAALEGARQILIEHFAEDAGLLGELREYLWNKGVLHSRLVEGKESEGRKFSDYFDYQEPVARIPSHRALALFRGRADGVLALELQVDEDAPDPKPAERRIAARFGIAGRGRAADAWLLETVRRAWRVKLFTHLDLDLKMRLREQAEAAAIEVFAANLKDLLLAAPAGHHRIIGLDPGLRTGVKVAVVDETGKVLASETIHPHPPRRQWDAAIATLATLARRHGATLLSIGNGTASRETERLARDLARRHPGLGLRFVVVSEAGASVYSASELASQELPAMDVSLRGAVSIARRLQDPLAELVKIEPKAIGVGQYQHDVDQARLARSLENVVEDCVNAVGVDVNTASPALLRQVSGLNRSLADKLVAYRDAVGAFRSRRELLKVPRLGAKTFEQAAGFLRIPDADDPLDASAVHPEAYGVARRIAERHGREVGELIGDRDFLRGLNPADYTDERFGVPTVRDIIAELEKPGRDPRPEFKSARFREGIEKPADLEPGMVLEGVVTNVTDFGAFVDIGVHQDGLVHVSAMAGRFVRNPREVARAGDVVRVKVMSVDLERQRIGLSMRLEDTPGEQPAARKPAAPARPRKGGKPRRGEAKKAGNASAKPQGAMANALAGALRKGSR